MSSNRRKHIASLVERPNVRLEKVIFMFFCCWWDWNDCVTLQLFKAARCANLPNLSCHVRVCQNVHIVLSYFRILLCKCLYLYVRYF